MSSLLEVCGKLKEILHIGDITITVKDVCFLKLGEKEVIKEDGERGRIILDPTQLDEEQKSRFEKEVAPLLLGTGRLLIDDKSVGILDGAEAAEEKDELRFFKGILEMDDYRALCAAQIIKTKFEKKENVDELKHQLWIRYRNRGANISNLYSAGYFELLKKVYIEFTERYGGEAKDKFLSFFDTFVGDPPFVLFVNRNMGKNDLLRILEKKINECKRYGLGRLNVHAIGKENISKTKEAILELQKTIEFEVRFEDRHGIFMAEIGP